jgi:hypothetical protein
MSQGRIVGEMSIISLDEMKAPSGIPPPKALASTRISGDAIPFKQKHGSGSAESCLTLIKYQESTHLVASVPQNFQKIIFGKIIPASACIGSTITQAVSSVMRFQHSIVEPAPCYPWQQRTEGTGCKHITALNAESAICAAMVCIFKCYYACSAGRPPGQFECPSTASLPELTK